MHQLAADLDKVGDMADNKLAELYDISVEDVVAVRAYVWYCEGLRDKSERAVVEQRVATTIAGEQLFGTSDFLAWSEFETLHVIDLKTGSAFNRKRAKDSSQLRIYAIMAIDTFGLDVSQIHMAYYQSSCDSPIEEYTITMAELDEYREYLTGRIEHGLAHPDEHVPGDHCDEWCPALRQGLCPEHVDRALAVVEDDLSGALVSTDRLIEILDARKHIEKQLKGAERLAIKYLQGGGSLGHWTLAPSYGHKAWTKPVKAVVAALRRQGVEEPWDKKPITPAVAKRRGVSDEWLDKWTERPVSGERLVSGAKQQKGVEALMASVDGE
jgi:hypothetical protein